MSPLARFVPPPSPVDAITKALNVAETVYGIKGASQKAEQIQRAMDLQAQQNDPTSDVSQERQATTGALLGTLSKAGSIPKDQFGGITALIPKMSAANLAADPSLNSLIGMREKQMQAEAMAAVAGMKNQTFADKNGIQISKDYESRMEPYRKLNEDVTRVESALATKDKNGNPLITPQQLGDANASIARIFSPGHMSDATVNRTEYESLPAKFSAALQKISADPTDIGSRNLINHIIDQAHHIANVSNDNALKELQSLDEGYQQMSNQEAKNIAAKKSNFYLQRFNKKYPTVGGEDQTADSVIPGVSNAAAAPTPHISQDAVQAEIQRRRAMKKR